MDKPNGTFAPVRGALATIMKRLTGGDGTQGLDQIARLVQRIRETPNSKRLYVTAYDPIDMEDCFVTTCHGLFFCQIWGDRLNLHMIQRSGDVPVGIPFNIASYSLLMYMLAQVTGLKPGVFHHTISDAHLYDNQVPSMQELLVRPPKPYPTLTINPEVTDIFAFTLADFAIEGYETHPRLEVPVAT
jgi:thymidylate synthase